MRRQLSISLWTVFIAVSMVVMNLPAAEKAGRSAIAAQVIRKGVDYLLSQRHGNGGWGNPPQPAITALALVALHQPLLNVTSDAQLRKKVDESIKFLLEFRKANGAFACTPQRHYLFFSDRGYPVYTTSLVLLALHKWGYAEKYAGVMTAARNYLKTAQFTDEGKYQGGFSYYPGAKPDMGNSAWAIEALAATEYLEKEPFSKSKQTKNPAATKGHQTQLWPSVQKFLASSQNYDPEQPEKKDGGFGYRPGLVSSGSMTYAGLKSMVYAKLSPSDPRVKGVMRYLRNHYTLDENPGRGQVGYYYYLLTFAKALNALHIDHVVTSSGDRHPWRDELIQKVKELQHADGKWVNPNGKYMESDPLIVTSYALIALAEAAH
ncbi:MAG: hypothetical protein D6820_08070 [Lentisphaerae bacterium]|nr:MAG: hypothetical protein D6820_08070 [Lentisphaerota bacterium]